MTALSLSSTTHQSLALKHFARTLEGVNKFFFIVSFCSCTSLSLGEHLFRVSHSMLLKIINTNHKQYANVDEGDVNKQYKKLLKLY